MPNTNPYLDIISITGYMSNANSNVYHPKGFIESESC